MPPDSPDTVICSSRVMTPDGVGEGEIFIRDGRIMAVAPPGEISHEEYRVEHVGDRLVMPGLIDPHVHVNEPGRTEWEGFATATQAAACGGITTLIDMPLNSTPVTTTPDAFKIKLNAAENQLWIDVGFWGGVVPENIPDHLDALTQSGVFGCKAFLIHSGIDDFPNVTEADLRQAMPVLAKANLPLLVHAELDCNHQAPVVPGIMDRKSYGDYLASRPKKWEMDAIELMIRLCREYGCPVHIVHLSCADALPMLHAARQEGLPITVETCPHYLCLAAETVPTGDTRYKCAPPIREKVNAERLWQGLADGIIDFIVSDHSPCTPELKLLDQGDFEGAWGGIASLQFGLPAIWTEARQRGFSLEQLSRWMSEGPARFLKLDRRKGKILPGYDADLVIWEPDKAFVVKPDIIRHRHKITPYDGKTLYGKTHQTWLGGRKIFDDGNLIPEPVGRPLMHQVSPLKGAHV